MNENTVPAAAAIWLRGVDSIPSEVQRLARVHPAYAPRRFPIVLLALAAWCTFLAHGVEHAAGGTLHAATCSICLQGATPDIPADSAATGGLTCPSGTQRLALPVDESPLVSAAAVPGNPRAPPPALIINRIP